MQEIKKLTYFADLGKNFGKSTSFADKFSTLDVNDIIFFSKEEVNCKKWRSKIKKQKNA